jgi:hypothetical protein
MRNPNLEGLPHSSPESAWDIRGYPNFTVATRRCSVISLKIRLAEASRCIHLKAHLEYPQHPREHLQLSVYAIRDLSKRKDLALINAMRYWLDSGTRVCRRSGEESPSILAA